MILKIRCLESMKDKDEMILAFDLLINMLKNIDKEQE
jgi:hypothetical protein